jgi:23S rRNA pseudouridine1911/1915/1917 synthase
MSSNDQLTSGVYRFVVPAGSLERRLDQFLADEIEQLSRGMARKLIDLGGVHVDGRRVRRCSFAMMPGQRVECYVDGLPPEPFRLESDRILYRDPYLLALDKPAGVPTQPTPARFQGTLYAALLQFLGHQTSLGMVQRLDRDTSGVLVFSTHPKAHKGLTAAFREHQVVKRYLALVSGRLPDAAGEISSQLARRRATNRMVSVERGGREALTRYRVAACFAEATLVEVEIPTGRTHQIRVHFAEIGHALLGDDSYGGPVVVGGVDVRRQMLHASELSLDHPVDGRRLELKSVLPNDFQTLLRRLAEAG